MIESLSSGTSLVGRLDEYEQIEFYIKNLSKKAVNINISSLREFENAYLQFLATRIIGSNLINEFSVPFTGNFEGIRRFAKRIFEGLIRFVDIYPNPSVRYSMYAQLSYLKPESSAIGAQLCMLASSGLNDTSAVVSPDFMQYMLWQNTAVDRFGRQFSAAEHFARTDVVTLVGEKLQCRIAHGDLPKEIQIYCGCSTADNLVFDFSMRSFDAYVTIPGLSLRHITSAFLRAIYSELLVKRMKITDVNFVHVTICVGFVDRLKVIGALQQWDRMHLERKVAQLVDNAIRATREATLTIQNTYFTLYPGSFPVPIIHRTMVNGVVPFSPENASSSALIAEYLSAASPPPGGGELFVSDALLHEEKMIHDREIHPRLGERLDTLAPNS